MDIRRLLSLILFYATFVTTHAQERQPNPFEEIGKKAKIETLSNGKYEEFFDMDSVQRIGTVLFNINTHKVVKLLNSEEVYKKASNNTTSSRRYNIDPLWEDNKSVSPYAVFNNNPILFSDPNGDCPNCITAALGAGIGALIGGGMEMGMQLYKHGAVKNWGAVVGSTLQGAVTGGVAGLTGGASLLVTTTAAGVANGVGGAVNNAVQGKKITAGSVATDVAVGAVFGAVGKYLGDKASSYFNQWSEIGSTGKVGEAALKELGGESQIFFKTSTGGRYIDQLVDDIAHESKVGYTSLTETIRTQIAKDVELIKSGEIKGSVWHFFKSPKTGQSGATKPLLDELKKNGINYIIHKNNGK